MKAPLRQFSAAVNSFLLIVSWAACSSAAERQIQRQASTLELPSEFDWQKRAETLEAKGFRDEARQVIQRAFSDTGNLVCIGAWLEMDEKLFLLQDRRRRTITRWQPQTIPLSPLWTIATSSQFDEVGALVALVAARAHKNRVAVLSGVLPLWIFG